MPRPSDRQPCPDCLIPGLPPGHGHYTNPCVLPWDSSHGHPVICCPACGSVNTTCGWRTVFFPCTGCGTSIVPATPRDIQRGPRTDPPPVRLAAWRRPKGVSAGVWLLAADPSAN